MEAHAQSGALSMIATARVCLLETFVKTRVSYFNIIFVIIIIIIEVMQSRRRQ